MNATFVFADYPPYNSSEYRIFTPAKYLKQSGHSIRVVHADQVTEVDEVVLVERNLNEDDLLRYKAFGAKRIIYTFDDAYRVIPTNTASTNYWRGENQKVLDLAPVIRKIYKAIVPCESLARNYNATVIPNFHDPDWVREKVVHDDGKVVIGWGGSSGHHVTWQNGNFLQAIGKIQEEFDYVELVTVGGFPTGYSAFNYQHTHKMWVEFDQWKNWTTKKGTFYSSEYGDIGFTPSSVTYREITYYGD